MGYLTLHNGRRMPALGLGTWDLRGQTCVETIPRAWNWATASSTPPRCMRMKGGGPGPSPGRPAPGGSLGHHQDFPAGHHLRQAKAAIQRSLDQLALDYIDLLLIHGPTTPPRRCTWPWRRAYQARTLRAIGISNFHEARYQTFLAGCQVVPMVNQVESHVYFLRKDLQRAMAAHGTVTQAWAPFTEGRRDLFSEPVLQEVGRRHGKTAAQVALRYLLQNGMGVVVKSSRLPRLAENSRCLTLPSRPRSSRRWPSWRRASPSSAGIHEGLFSRPGVCYDKDSF